MDNILHILCEKLQNTNNHKEYYNKYSMLKTDDDRVLYTIDIIQKYNIHPIIINNNKNIVKSIEYKDRANKLYTMPVKISQLQLNNIIELYTMSIVYAPLKSRELSLSYANRSAALFTAKLYNECLIDIKRALSLNYPDELKVKLYCRRVRCLMILSISNTSLSIELNDAIDKIHEYLDNMDINNPGRIIIERVLNNKIDVSNDNQRILLDDERNLPIIPNDNNEIFGVSSAININYNDKYGRHIIATRDIEPGEIISVQYSYSWILSSDKYYKNCWNCSRQIWCGIPCNYCINVIYCDDKCRDEAWNNYHDIECQVIGPLIALDMNNFALLSLKMVIKAVREGGGIQQLMNKLSYVDSCTDERTRGFVNNIFNDKLYESVYSLARNTDKRSVPDLFGRSLNSFYIVFMLATRSELFGKKLNNDIDELKNNKFVIFIGGLIMRHQQIIPSNVHSMTEECIDGEPIDRGAALMPFLSLFNHSCNPMVNRKSYGRAIALYTECIIKKGEQIYDNYGMSYALQSKVIRQNKLLRQYYFTCNCIACNDNWPLYSHLPSYKDKKLSNDVKKIIKKALKNYNIYYELATAGDIDNKSYIIEDLINMIRCLCKYVKLPCIEYNNVIETLKRINALQGSRWQSLN